MARIKIDIPEKWLFTCSLEVRVTDLNYGNHLANDKILSYAQEARIQFLLSRGRSELDFFGTSLIQGDAAIQYKSEGFLANQIEIRIGVMDVGSSSYDFVYDMYNKTTDKPLALVKTRMVCFNYDTRRVTKIPEAFIALVGLI
ncbi:MAG: thioesterase family protein [Bacteroidia bacterium]|nr:thioesterase family protein [Bacteroidia bacterium]